MTNTTNDQAGKGQKWYSDKVAATKEDFTFIPALTVAMGNFGPLLANGVMTTAELWEQMRDDVLRSCDRYNAAIRLRDIANTKIANAEIDFIPAWQRRNDKAFWGGVRDAASADIRRLFVKITNGCRPHIVD